MLRAYLVDQKRCYGHPHRTVKTACARCKTAYCDECLITRTDGLFGRVVERAAERDEDRPAPLFCSRCVEELEALNAAEAERRRPLWQKLRPTRRHLHRLAIYVAVAAVAMVPMAIAVRTMANTTLSPEELARIKVGLLGTFQSREGTNFLSQVYGGSFMHANAPSRPNHDPSRLIDTWVAPEVPSWRSQDASTPQDMVFALPFQLRINKVVLRPHASDPPETWVNEFEVWVSTTSPDGDFQPVASGALSIDAGRASLESDRADPPRFEFPEREARYVMLRVRSNHGSAEYISLGEFEVFWIKK